MKKILIVVALVILLAAAAYFFFFYSDRNYPERVFPDRTIAYGIFSGVDSIQKDGRQTLLWQKIEASPRKSLYSHQLDQLMSLSETAIGVDIRPILAAFSREVAIGIVPAGNSQAGALVGYVRRTSRAQEYIEMNLDPALKRRLPDLKKSLASYGEVRYYKYSSAKFPPQISLCYIFLDHHLILASSEAGMKSLLDVHDKKLPSLRKSDAFRDSKRQVNYRNGILFYVNGESALQWMKSRMPARAQSFWPGIVQVTGIQAIRGFGYSIGFDKDGFREEGYVSVDSKRQGIAKAYMEQRPQKLAGLNFVPADSQAAGASTLPDGLGVWKEIDTQLQNSQLRSFLQLLSGFMNFDFQKDLFEPIGRQVTYGYQLPPDGADLRNTAYFMALELRNPGHFREVVDRLASLGQVRGIVRTQENYQGMNLDLLSLHAGSMDINSAYTINGSWFYFSTAQNFLKKAIDAMKTGKNITSLPDFKKVTAEFPNEVNGISYTNIQTTFSTYASIMQNMAQEPDQRWIHDYQFPEELRYLSQSLFGSGSYTMIEKDGIRYHSYSSVPKALLYVTPFLASQH
jgi:uncharacterized protein DUF3352